MKATLFTVLLIIAIFIVSISIEPPFLTSTVQHAHNGGINGNYHDSTDVEFYSEASFTPHKGYVVNSAISYSTHYISCLLTYKDKSLYSQRNYLDQFNLYRQKYNAYIPKLLSAKGDRLWGNFLSKSSEEASVIQPNQITFTDKSTSFFLFATITDSLTFAGRSNYYTTNFTNKLLPIVGDNNGKHNILLTFSKVGDNNVISRRMLVSSSKQDTLFTTWDKDIITTEADFEYDKLRVFEFKGIRTAFLTFKEDQKSTLYAVNLKTMEVVFRKEFSNNLMVIGSHFCFNDYKFLSVAESSPNHTNLYKLSYMSGNTITTSSLPVEINDCVTVNNSQKIIALSDKYIYDIDIETFEILKSKRFKNNKIIYGPYTCNDKDYLITSDKESKLTIIDTKLNIGVTMDDYSFIKDSSLDINLIESNEDGIEKILFSISALTFHDNKRKTKQTTYEVLPTNIFLYLFVTLKKYMYNIFFNNLLYALGFLLLIGITITLFNFTLKIKTESKIASLSTYLPLPMIKTSLTKILKQIKRPKLTNVCILNVDIVNFSGTIQRIDDTDAISKVLNNFYRLFIDESSKRDGVIGKIMGDGMIALYGWPDFGGLFNNHLQEDITNSIETARAVIDRINNGELNIDNHSINIRLGLTIGSIYMGHFGNKIRKDLLAIGDSIDRSEIIQKNADMNILYIDSHFKRVCQENYQFRNCKQVYSHKQDIEICELIF